MRFFSATRETQRVALPTVANCKDCGIYKTCRSPKIQPKGKGKRRVLIVGDRPGELEDKQGKPFVGPVGRYLLDVIRKCGYDLWEDCTVTNAVICFTNNEKKNDEAVKHCQANLISTVKQVNPEVIIPLGEMAVRSLLSWIWKEDVGPIGRWVGFQIPSQRLNAWICPSWNPSYLLRNRVRGQVSPLLASLFEQHIQSAMNIDCRPWSRLPDLTKGIRRIYNPAKAAKAIREIMKDRSTPQAFDYETTMLKPDHKDARIYSCAISDGKTAIAYPWHGEAVKATGEFLQSDIPKIGYHQKFEDRWTKRKLGHWVNNWVWDGMVRSHLIDNRKGITSLKFQAFALFGIDSYDDEIKPYLHSNGSNTPNRIHEAPLDKILQYNAIDALLEARVAYKQSKVLGIPL